METAHALRTDELKAHFKVEPDQGLSSARAKEALAKYGPKNYISTSLDPKIVSKAVESNLSNFSVVHCLYFWTLRNLIV